MLFWCGDDVGCFVEFGVVFGVFIGELVVLDCMVFGICCVGLGFDDYVIDNLW